jgi:AraC-like DNA-binding protein
MQAARPAPEHSTSARAVLPFIDFLRAKNHDPNQVLERTGYTEAALREPRRRLPHSAVVGIVEAVIELADEPGLGFVVATHMAADTFDLLEYAARSSATLREALEVANRYARLADDSVSFRLEPLGERYAWRLDMNWPPSVQRCLVEYVLGVLASMGARLFGSIPSHEEIWFRGAPPPDQARYERRFPSRVRFGTPYDACVFAPEVLEQPIRGADPTLSSLLKRHAEEELERVLPPESLADQVQRLILEELRGGDPGMPHIARRLATTPSTLRRRLAAESLSFRELLDKARLEMARAYLADSRLAISEISYLLAFRSASAFFKSFKRWTGLTPAEYRRRKP